MRRRPGVSGIQDAARAREQYRSVGNEVRKSNLEAMREQMALFKDKLEEFAMNHRAEIRKDPAFRAQFHAMCANIGVDPLASNKGLWAKTLGLGDFYYELGVQIIEACWATRAANGGLMDVRSLLRMVNKRRGKLAEEVSLDDVERAIKKLKALGGGFELVRIGGSKYARSVPGELNMDKNEVLGVAQVAGGFVAASELERNLKWTPVRVQEVLQGLLAEGLAMVDDLAPEGERLYWFPCLSSGMQEEQ
uniref:Vacuolar protein sorting-associated protein n=2 Tax=Dunaliella tertiolecta TaxID=3047 RepID=A0A7S3QMV5_DUNTE|mmetsp:Transcript_13809/g.37308  ORF Transcript_13809/g.37308 Transcript_13809/m.37308 type:complete len:249 (-) Transcript_13809:718-1464(-)|eukprot:CAMPEP_0202342890 /NCGR_PEP_ID=MMETSP1126-20121109/3259_1 /ASSEMBLY_ACC=CAM_ASM_000457 /TAXON_ID=3047 /ORGANISM="Dunaliella tertiolecta, Strain CCMP1320" /LENGTH=248 /DNA_ID=CAMNT_0048933907 /DNA_START=99 /DNA_END=845 /DNA_ORIENTATION=-